MIFNAHASNFISLLPYILQLNNGIYVTRIQGIYCWHGNNVSRIWGSIFLQRFWEFLTMIQCYYTAADLNINCDPWRYADNLHTTIASLFNLTLKILPNLKINSLGKYSYKLRVILMIHLTFLTSSPQRQWYYILTQPLRDARIVHFSALN